VKLKNFHIRQGASLDHLKASAQTPNTPPAQELRKMVPTETIYKYPFNVKDALTIELPQGAQILLVECQGGQPCLWAKVDPDARTVPRFFRIYGTGHPIDPFGSPKHIASFQQQVFVWHLFEVTYR
jgi:hypothetical protein